MFLITIAPVHATDGTTQSISNVIEQISITGLRRTRPDIILRELGLKKNEILTPDKLSGAIQNLENLRLFSHISSELKIDRDNRAHIEIKLREKWTTIPIFNYTQGGETSYLVAGLYDINLAGKYVETGAQYESWNGKPGGVIWFRNPRLLNKHIHISGDLWSVRRPRLLFDENGNQITQYLLNRKKMNFALEFDIKTLLTIGAGIETNLDTLNLTSIMQPLIKTTHYSESYLSHISLKYGKINFGQIHSEGSETQLKLSQSLPVNNSALAFSRILFSYQRFYKLPRQHNLAIQYRTGATNAKNLQHQFFLGGLSQVRGYSASQLTGKAFAQSNIEYRARIGKTTRLIPQANLFIDAAVVDSGQYLYSAGVGFRIIAPEVYRFTNRLDIALHTSHPSLSRISFGVQQFF